MKRIGLSLKFPAITIAFVLAILTLGSPTATAETATPLLVVDTVTICLGDTINDTVVVPLTQPINDTASITKISGPGTFEPQTGDSLFGYYMLTPDTAGTYEVVYNVVEPDSTYYSITYRYIVYANQPPVGEDLYISAFTCFEGDGRYPTVTATDPEGDPLTFSLISAPINVNVDPQTGDLSYWPPSTGVYDILVEVSDGCGSDTILVSDTIQINELPVFTGYDTTVTLCAPEEICLPLSASDADGDPLVFRRVDTSSLGTLTQPTDTTAELCFTPGMESGATYTFVVCVVDTCNIKAGQEAANYTCVEDTIRVTVNMNQPPVIVCPDPQTFYTCALDTFCFDIDVNDPEFGPVQYSILSENATIDGNTVCVEGSQDAQFDVIIVATDTCGLADTCTVPVTIQGNRPPVATLGDDFSMLLCDPQTICLDAFADDPDFDLDSAFSNYGVFDPQNTSICFTADTAGVYEIILTAIDSCGAFDEDTAYVTISISDPPLVDLGDDLNVNVCGPEAICFSPTVSVDSLMSVMTWPAEIYDMETGRICFTPDTAGSYRIIMKVEDYCGKSDTDTLFVNVTLGQELALDLGNDTTITQCESGQICLPVTGTLTNTSFETTFGSYDTQTGEICFTPDTSGTYTIIGTVSDSCGASLSDTVNVTVTTNTAPVLADLPDTTVYLCFPTEICLPINATDADGDPLDITVSKGTYKDGAVCFVPYDSGYYEFIVTATDTCGASAVDTAIVTVKTDQGLTLECPNDTSLFTCGADTFAIPINIIGRPDSSEVVVTGINTWWHEETQTVRFFAECSNTNRITVTVKTPCGEESCTFTATVDCNSEPLVILPQDTTVALCTPDQTFCLPVGASDVDNNLDSIHVEGATYDEATGTVCFTPGQQGEFVIGVTAVDSCGAIDIDSVTVMVIGNTAPTVSLSIDSTTIRQCSFDQICLDVTVSDIEKNLASVSTSFGNYDTETGTVCFTPDTSGVYCVEVIAVDECGLADTASQCITVELGDFVSITCPDGPITVDTLCTAGEVCVNLFASGTNYTITPSLGTWANNKLCFNADTAGTYQITVIGDAECNSDTCIVTVTVPFAPPAELTCPNDTSVSLCGPDTLLFDYTASGANSVSVSGGYLDNGQVAVPILEAGEKIVTLVAVGDCGNDTCSFIVNTAFNSPPVVQATDTSMNACELNEICLPFSVTDDNTIDSVTTSLGSVVDRTVCFTPTNYGTYNIIITAWDDCGATGVDTATVTIIAGGVATILCPANQVVETICGPDTICVTVPISPSNAEVTVSPRGYYDAQAGTICVPVDQTELIDVEVIADATCGSDTCNFQINVTHVEPATVSCPPTVDTLLCLAEPTQLCYPVTVTGTNPTITVSPIGSYANGEVCMTVDTAGTYEMMIVAENECATDTCYTTITVDADQAPEITLPQGLVIERCADDTNTVCINGIDVFDAEGDATLSMVCGNGSFNLDALDQLCFVPDSVGPHTFCFEASDGCNTVVDTLVIDFIERPDCDVCVRVSIDITEPVPVGVEVEVPIRIETNDAIGGFDLLVKFDASVMTFLNATIEGSAIDAWEYFTYSTGSGGCGGACPSGLVRLVAIADVNNGSFHPPDESLSPEGVLAFMNFRVANDQTLGDQFLPISFAWYECRDNTFSDPTGNFLYTDLRIFNSEGGLIWDEDDDIAYPESSRPFGIGTRDICIDSDKNPPLRCVEFMNGGIKVVHPDSIDLRGDINLNNIPYEISDAVLYSNYFVQGLSVFILNVAGQIAASDVNNDGYTLSVADLVLMIRIIIGDADPIPKSQGISDQLTLRSESSDNAVAVTTETASDIGAAWLVYNLPSGSRVNDVAAGSDASHMTIDWSVTNNQLRVLVYDIGTNRIASGTSDLLQIDYSGNTPVLDTAEFADYYGRALSLSSNGPSLPSQFSLSQNYPNPFNPSTQISFTLPQQERWNLQIFSITGELVREFSGADGAGEVTVTWDGLNNRGSQVASGVYFYRLQVADFSDTRKMVLLK